MTSTVQDAVTLSRKELQTLFYPGREIRLVSCLLGGVSPDNQYRKVLEQKSFGYIMQKASGSKSWLRFETGDTITFCDALVSIISKTGELQAQYSLA